MPNTATFTVQKEDHTLGNVLCCKLQAETSVIFSGYKMPHPLDHHFILKIQTDKTTTPLEVVQFNIDKLIGDLSMLEERVKAEVRRVQMTSMGGSSTSSIRRMW